MGYLEANADCVAVGSRMLIMDAAGMPIRTLIDELDHETIEREHLRGIPCVRHSGVTMPRWAVLKVGGYDEKFIHAEDLDLFLRLAEIGKLRNIPQTLIDVRLHENSICGQHFALGRQSAKRAAVDVAFARRGLTPQPWKDTPARSRNETHRVWAWWALSEKNVATARKHAIAAFRSGPFNVENMRVLACALRGH